MTVHTSFRGKSFRINVANGKHLKIEEEVKDRYKTVFEESSATDWVDVMKKQDSKTMLYEMNEAGEFEKVY